MSESVWRHPRTALYGVALLAMLGSPSQGRDPPFVIGAGAGSCGTWTTTRNSPRRLEYEAWLVGYFSAVNRFVPGVDGDVTNGVEGRGLIAWMDNFCLSHPLNMIETGAVQLLEELRRQRAVR
jgi:hypothetical protein